MICPFDNVTPCNYVQQDGTHIWICEKCPFIAFEFINQKDLDNLGTYLNR